MLELINWLIKFIYIKGRALEIIQILAKHVMDNKSRLDVDNLIYLSPMSHNIIEFAKSQLEWMSDSLCDPFYKVA